MLLAADELRIVVGEEGQLDVSLTIYNDNFALIHERREIALPVGRFELEYQDVARTIDPSSVQVSSDGGSLVILEQSYHYDLVNKRILLEKFLGRKIKYSRTVLDGNQLEKVLREGILLSINPEVVLFGDEIEIGPEGTISLAYEPNNLRTVPTLLWRMDNKHRDDQKLEVSYIATGISWRPDYVFTLNQLGTRADLVAWVTIENRSGAQFWNAKVKLVAGNVKRLQAARRGVRHAVSMEMADVSASRKQMPSQNSFFDYHLYEFDHRSNFLANSVKQLRLLEAKDIRVTQSYSFSGEVVQYQRQGVQKQNADIQISFVNNGKNNLDVPLPSGRFRTYKQDEDGQLLFVGEDSIAHTPADSDVNLIIGQAFDVTAKRTQVAYRRLGDRGAEVSYEIVVKNNKKEKIEVSLKEMLQGDWTIVQQSHKGERSSSGMQLFKIKLAKGKEETVRYTVRFNY